MEHDEYPHWKTALFGNGHAANLYCAVKYATWHVAHLLLVAIGAVFVVVFVPLSLGWWGLVALADGVAARLPEPEPQAGPTLAMRVSRTARQAQHTPVVRRLYGECPVDLKMDPRWYARLEDWAANVVDAVQPPDMVAVCPECADGFTWGEYRVGDECRYCGSTYVAVREDRVEQAKDEDRLDEFLEALE